MRVFGKTSSSVGMVQVKSGKTARALKKNAIVAYLVHVVQVTTEKFRQSLNNHRSTLARRLHVMCQLQIFATTKNSIMETSSIDLFSFLGFL